jgi:4-hydroxy-3-polyprenylbenzoate decarboxylase
MGMDATNKWPGETMHEWGRTMAMTPAVTAKVDQVWQTLGL